MHLCTPYPGVQSLFMKLRSILISAAMLTMAGHSFACGRLLSRGKHVAAAKTTTADVGEDAYDIHQLAFNLRVSDTSIAIAGDVTTSAVTISSMSEYVFELDTCMHIDSAKFNGALVTVNTTVPATRKITIASALSVGNTFTAQIFYHGMPPSGAGFFNGVTHAVTSGGTHMMYTVSDPWVARNWWPCKQSVNDKIDDVDMNVTVPTGVKVTSNGLLTSTDNTSIPGYSIYHWQTHEPINYYLISIAVARYAEYKSYMHFSGSSDSMLIQNFFLDTASFNPLYKPNFDSIGYILDYFSSLYGRYPFWQEKYGMSYTNLSGGMEHQTMTTIGVPNTYIIAHELTHQWFGDNVTYKTWGDMWLSEGFATFSEQLFFNHFWGPAAAKSHRQGFISQAVSQPCGMTYVNDTTTSDSLFTNNQYPKAAMIISTLRYMAPEDSLFFRVLRTYQNTYARGNASTANFKAIAEATYGFPLDTFFNQWIYGRGYPMYKVTWDQVGSTVWVKLVQTQSCPSYTTHFSTPVELQLHGATADTIVKVYNTLDTQIYTFNWSPTMSTVYLNPDAVTLLKQNGGITKDVKLGVGVLEPRNIKVRPNPSKNNWMIDELPEDAALALLDMSGKVLWKGNSSKGSTLVPGDRLPAGNYLLKLNGTNEAEVKLVHW
jgi:aminopeptidase N